MRAWGQGCCEGLGGAGDLGDGVMRDEVAVVGRGVHAAPKAAAGDARPCGDARDEPGGVEGRIQGVAEGR